nr:PREDICTED: uncharacterized protein LOC103314812 isoform X2 [Tribolium castaneum]|eukprot:XP_008199989.1 PREDICTED: uncharacterized protein LOC103314812 isoform X2 [Tribolium castaneum]
MACAVKSCQRVRKFKPEGVAFHLFPTGHLLAAWKKALNLPDNWTWSRSKFVCSEHFKRSDYVLIGKYPRLKLNAVPSAKLGKKGSETGEGPCLREDIIPISDPDNKANILEVFVEPKPEVEKYEQVEELQKEPQNVQQPMGYFEQLYLLTKQKVAVTELKIRKMRQKLQRQNHRTKKLKQHLKGMKKNLSVPHIMNGIGDIEAVIKDITPKKILIIP